MNGIVSWLLVYSNETEEVQRAGSTQEPAV